MGEVVNEVEELKMNEKGERNLFGKKNICMKLHLKETRARKPNQAKWLWQMEMLGFCSLVIVGLVRHIATVKPYNNNHTIIVQWIEILKKNIAFCVYNELTFQSQRTYGQVKSPWKYHPWPINYFVKPKKKQTRIKRFRIVLQMCTFSGIYKGGKIICN